MVVFTLVLRWRRSSMVLNGHTEGRMGERMIGDGGDHSARIRAVPLLSVLTLDSTLDFV